MSLLTQQRHLRAHLLANRPEPVAGIAAMGLPGLAVYRNNYRGQLLDCLGDTFEKTQLWMGDDAFVVAGELYIDLTPPSSWTLADYGRDFGPFLSRRFADDPEIGELAWLDWALRRAFDGPDARSLAGDDLGALDWEAAVFSLAPTLAVREVHTNCAALWSAMAEGATPPAAEPLASPAWIRVWKTDLSPRYRTIDGFEHQALALVGQGLCFGELCRRLAPEEGEPAVAQLGALLGRWLADGLICSAA